MPALFFPRSVDSADTDSDSRQLEASIRRALLAEDGLEVASLAVRRLPNGVCLEGVIRVHSDDMDVCRAIRQIDGVGQIVNHLVVCWNCPDPGQATPDETMF